MSIPSFPTHAQQVGRETRPFLRTFLQSADSELRSPRMRNTPREAKKTAEACVQRASGPLPSVEEIFTRLSTGLQCSYSYPLSRPIGFCPHIGYPQHLGRRRQRGGTGMNGTIRFLAVIGAIVSPSFAIGQIGKTEI